jgi:alpha-mannosidase
LDLKREIVEAKYQSRLWELIGDKDGTVDCLINYAKSYQTNHILIPAGSDFSFQFADLSYKFMEDAMQILSANQIGSKKFKFMYSTVDTYYQVIREHTFSTENIDFFPYNGNFNLHYWTGFYTSRPEFKRLIRTFTQHS